MKYITCTIAVLLLAQLSFAANPDFRLEANECQMLIGSFANKNVQVGKADPPSYACNKHGKQITCSVSFKGNSKPDGNNTETFSILLDSPPYLYFTGSNGANFFSINTSMKVGIMTFRLTELTYTGEKVCSATYKE